MGLGPNAQDVKAQAGYARYMFTETSERGYWLGKAFRPLDGGLRRLIFARCRGGCAGGSGSGNGLAGIAHFLHGRTGHAPKQAGDTN